MNPIENRYLQLLREANASTEEDTIRSSLNRILENASGPYQNRNLVRGRTSLVRAFPSHTFNALCAPVGMEGHLILVNDGMVVTVIEVAALVASRMTLGGMEPKPLTYSKEAYLNAILSMGTLRGVTPLLLSEEQRRWANLFADSMLEFGVAHEMSHMELGHQVIAIPSARFGTEPRLKALWRSQTQEAAADLRAVDGVVMFSTQTWLPAQLQHELRYVGPLLWFELAHDFEAAYRDTSQDLGPGTHPTARERLEFVLAEHNPSHYQARFTFLNYLAELVDSMRPNRTWLAIDDSPAVRDVIKRLEGWSDASDIRKWQAVTFPGGGIDLNGLGAVMSRDLRAARSMVSTALLCYLRLDPLLRLQQGTYFGLSLIVMGAVGFEDESAEIFDLVNGFLPQLNEILARSTSLLNELTAGPD